MCTVTIIPVRLTDRSGPHLRLVANRDELRSRAQALPPKIHALDGHDALWPTDPVGGGTWIGAAATGLIATLLNRNDNGLEKAPVDRSNWAASGFAGRRSRGEIIPQLLRVASIEDAMEFAQAIVAREYAPFRLVVIDGQSGFELTSDGRAISPLSSLDLSRPVMFTSSGLGDQLVECPRRDLFDEWFSDGSPAQWPALQQAFHRHGWPERPELSVLMARRDARTVSVVSVDRAPATIGMSYQAVTDQGFGTEHDLLLDRAGVMLG